MMVKVDGKSVTMHYGTQKMWELVPMYGEEVLRIPEECVSLHNFQKEVLHMEDSWVRSTEWPFLALSTASQVAVVPFEESDQEGIMPALVLVVPLGFFTTAVRLAWNLELDKHILGGGTAQMRMYRDAVHYRLGNLQTLGLTVLITLMFKHNVPAILTLAKH